MKWDDPSSWAVAVAVCAALAIWGHPEERRVVHWMFKPLAMALMIAAAFYFPSGLSAAAFPWFAAALFLSLAGDIALMFGSRFLLAGLIGFLVAHIAFATAFTLGIDFTPLQLAFILPPLAVSTILLHQLWPHLGTLRLPATMYVSAITVMVWRILARFEAPDIPMTSVIWGVAGASLFVLSDSLLAFRRFAQRAPLPYGVELGAYFAGQWCLLQATWTA